MSGIDTERIKSRFYEKLAEEEKLKNRKAKLTPIVLVAAIVFLMGATVFAANWGVFNAIFSNFADISDILQSVNVRAESSGITMKMTSYLADTKGIVPELVFTRNDGSTFATDVMAVSAFDYPTVKINNINRRVSPKNIVSDDGKAYYCLPIIHYDIEKITDSSLEISVDKLIYNLNETNEIADINLYDAYKKADVKIFDNIDSLSDLQRLFDGVKDNPIQTEIGIAIDAIVFAKVKETEPDTDATDANNGMPPADGIDLAGLYSNRYNNIVGIKYKNIIKQADTEYIFEPVKLENNNDPLGMGLGIGNTASYHFFRVDDFEDLKNMNGIVFTVSSNNFINGKWRIKTNFASNSDLNTVDINKVFAIEDLNTTLTLAKANISLLSTELSYEVKDNEGNLITNISGYDMNVYYLNSIVANDVKLRYSDGSEVNLQNFSFTGGSDGIINVSYDVEMNPDNYTLMNTNKLSAVIVNGESFKVN